MSSEKASDKSGIPAETPAREAPTSDINVLKARLQRDPRFNPPAPSVWKRVVLLLTIVVLFYVALKMRMAMFESQPQQPPVVHATR